MLAAVDEIENTLRTEGFRRTFVWSDGPGSTYPEHTHPTATAHVVIAGEITITSADGTRTYGRGERFDVPAEAAHSAVVGTQGCTYVVGER